MGDTGMSIVQIYVILIVKKMLVKLMLAQDLNRHL